MGMGFGANYGYIVSEKYLDTLDSWRALHEYLESIDRELDEDTAYALEEIAEPDLETEEEKETLRLWKAVQKEFNQKTNLSLSIIYHDSDNCGDRYDAVNGVACIAGGVTEYTPAGLKAINDQIIYKGFWVTFG